MVEYLGTFVDSSGPREVGMETSEILWRMDVTLGTVLEGPNKEILGYDYSNKDREAERIVEKKRWTRVSGQAECINGKRKRR